MHRESIAVAFTGHRTYRSEADEELRQLLEELYAEGARRYLCGMAWGFDLSAGEAVVQHKLLHEDVELVAVEPFAEFRSLFRGEDAERYDALIAAADCRVVVGENNVGAYMRRNDYLVDHSSLVVAWWDGRRDGGTAYTALRARRKGREVVNLYPDPQLNLPF
jgi:uncharacterized phage-like protein YoqJ